MTPEELRQRLLEMGPAQYREDWPDVVLDKLRKPFCASRDVVTIVLQELQLAPTDLYDRKRQQWAKREPWGRGGKRPPLHEQKLQEVGYSLANVLARAANQPSFSWLDASSVLGMKVEKAEAFLKWAHEHAR